MVNEIEAKRRSENIKFLCSYSGKILPRSSDGKLRYSGGLTRVFSVDRSINYAELMVKLGEFCGYSVNLRCQLPDGDLETLVSVKSDEDLGNIIEIYDQASAPKKIRAILSPPNSLKQISPPQSIGSPVNDRPRCQSCSSPLRFVDSGKAYYHRGGYRPEFFRADSIPNY